MPRSVRLRYHKARRQWRKKKKINGRNRYYYLGEGGVNKTDLDAYQKALAEWERGAGPSRSGGTFSDATNRAGG